MVAMLEDSATRKSATAALVALGQHAAPGKLHEQLAFGVVALARGAAALEAADRAEASVGVAVASLSYLLSLPVRRGRRVGRACML